MQAGLTHAGRYWTTTSRRSAKAKAIRRAGWAAATLADSPRWRVVAGPASVLDAVHPSTVVADPVTTLLAGGAMFRLGIGLLDQLVGYAEAGTAVPFDFLPTNRVVLVHRATSELVVSEDGIEDSLMLPTGSPARRWRPEPVLVGIPAEIFDLATQDGPAWLGIGTDIGPVAVPGAWDGETGRIRVRREVLALLAADLPGRIAVTRDHSDSKRPDEKLGVMLRGDGIIADADGTHASVAITVDRVTHWCGFVSGTVQEAA
jgi:hypothetical protein